MLQCIENVLAQGERQFNVRFVSLETALRLLDMSQHCRNIALQVQHTEHNTTPPASLLSLSLSPFFLLLFSLSLPL